MAVTDLDKARQVSEKARELSRVSRAIASNAITVELALERRDWDTVHEAADVVAGLSARFVELRRGLLVMSVRHLGD